MLPEKKKVRETIQCNNRKVWKGDWFGEDHEITINQKKEFNEKVKTAKQLLKSGHTKMETQRIINKKFKLNRAENASTGRYVRVASNLLDK